MSAQVGFVAAAARGAPSHTAIFLPMTALTQTDDKSGARPAVWLVAADGRVSLRPVTVARYTESGVQLAAGLAGGELVVVAGVHKLVPGQVVRPVEEPDTKTPPPAAVTRSPGAIASDAMRPNPAR